MDNNFLRTQYELPKSPAPTLYENDSNNNDDDDDVQFMGTITPSGVGPQINLGAQLPLLLATPPLSPPEIQGVPGANMPTVTSFLSLNYNQPSSYMMIIPCYLCKRPFTDVEQLRQHLNIHAQELMGTVAANVMVPPAAVGGNLRPKTTTTMSACVGTAPVFMEPVGATPVTLPPPGTSSTSNNNEQEWLSCFKCNKMFTQRAELHAHHSHCRSMQNIKKNNNNSKVNNNRAKDACKIKPFKCHLCQRRYMRDGARQRHVRLKHSWAASTFTPATPPMQPATPPMQPATPPMPPVTPPRALTPPTPPTSCEDVKPQIRKIYTTKQLNALAAANYNPAKESAAKYLPPTVGGSQLRKYPLRSPYFNPNLLNHDSDYF